MRGKKHVRLFSKTRTSFFENTYVNSEKHVRVFLNCEYWEIVRIFVL
jgi:hypothetical protein